MAVEEGLIGIVHSSGGQLVPTRSTLGCKMSDLLRKELTKDASQEFIRLHLEDGMYNFYAQEEDHTWKAYKYDTAE